MTRRAWIGIAGAMLLLAGCAADRAPPPPAPEAPPATMPPTATLPAGPVAVDGTYTGTKQLVRGGDGPGILCGQLDPFTVTVTNRHFSYVLHQPEVPFQPTVPFDVTIAADGSFRAVNGPDYITGTAGGGTMQGDVSGDACGYFFQAATKGQ